MKCLLRIRGPLLSKKNEWTRLTRWSRDAAGRRTPVHHIGLDEDAQAKVNALTVQLGRAWSEVQTKIGRRVSLRHPRILWKFGIDNPSKDKDGIRTTLLDCLQAAGVLYEDNIRHLNGWEHAAPAVIVPAGKEWAEIYIDWEVANETEPRKPRARPGAGERRRPGNRRRFRR